MQTKCIHSRTAEHINPLQTLAVQGLPHFFVVTFLLKLHEIVNKMRGQTDTKTSLRMAHISGFLSPLKLLFLKHSVLLL